MFADTFIRLVEEEYTKVVKEAEILKLQNGFTLREKPDYICERIQKFRNWFTIAMRCADLVEDGVGIKPEDAIMHTLISFFGAGSANSLQPGMLSALTLFDRAQIDALFGETRRLVMEQKTGTKFSECSFHVCYSHCKFVCEYKHKETVRGSAMEPLSS